MKRKENGKSFCRYFGLLNWRIIHILKEYFDNKQQMIKKVQLRKEVTVSAHKLKVMHMRKGAQSCNPNFMEYLENRFRCKSRIGNNK